MFRRWPPNIDPPPPDTLPQVLNADDVGVFWGSRERLEQVIEETALNLTRRGFVLWGQEVITATMPFHSHPAWIGSVRAGRDG